MSELLTQSFQRQSPSAKETHILPLPPCCPVSGNPQPGSTVEIEYEPKGCVLEVAALKLYIDSFIGGKGDIRSMEGMIDEITVQTCAILKAPVHVKANLKLKPDQEMVLHFYCWNWK